MKRILSLVWMAGCILLAACSDKGSTSPSKGDGKAIKTETIGSEGGVLDTENFDIEIPAGAFDAEQELTVYSTSAEKPFGDNCITDLYRLVGLPETFSKPLTVHIRYQGNLSEASWVAVGMPMVSTLQYEEVTGYVLNAARDSSGFLVGEFSPPPDGAPKTGILPYGRSADAPGSFYFGGVTGQGPHTTEHFQIIAPSGKADAAALARTGGYLENAYDVIGEFFGFRYDQRSSWPIQVTLDDLSANLSLAGSCFISGWGANYCCLNFEDDYAILPQHDNELRTTTGHEFFHLVQFLYSPADNWIPGNWQKYIWLWEAASTWSEEHFVTVPNYVSTAFEGRELAAFNGMQPAGNEDAGVHGYGMAVLVKYLELKHGTDIARKIFETVRSEGPHPVDAVVLNVETPAAWLEDFFSEFVTGNIYTMDPAFFMNAFSASLFEVKPGAPKTFQFRRAYRDLSAWIYPVMLKDPAVPAGTAVRFEASGGDPSGTEITVFEYNGAGRSTRRIAYGVDRVTVGGIREMTDRGSHLLVMVTNTHWSAPYKQTTDITLSGEIVTVSQNLTFNRAWVSLGDIPVHYDRETTDSGGGGKVSESILHYGSQSSSGSCANGEYRGTWDITNSNGHWQGEIRALFVGDPPQSIAELNSTETIEWTGRTETVTIRAVDIPLETSRDGSASFVARGQSAISKIVELQDTITLTGWQDTIRDWYYDSYWPSEIKAYFWTQQ
jgi:hypothetical protein